MKPGSVVLPIGAPDHYRDLLHGTEDVIFRKTVKSADIVHLFCRHRADLARRLPGALAKVNDRGTLWISWPKKSSSLFKNLTEGDLRTALLPTTNFIDVKVCAVDQDWSALKFLRRKA